MLDNETRDGHFRSILRYRAKGDEYLRKIIEGPGQRNKYISPIIQNQIIEACNTLILNKIITEINNSRCFFILVDETTDMSNIEQLTICVRYVDSNCILQENFLSSRKYKYKIRP